MNTKKSLWGVSALVALILSACTENIDTSARYVFQQETITSYLSKNDQYSEYLRLLGEVPVSGISETTVRQLLTARGHYTVFAPTNKAIQLYLDSLKREGIIDEASWDAFPSRRKRDSISQIIVYNSLINSGDDDNYFEVNAFPYPTSNSNSVEFPLPNMNDRKLTVQYTNVPDSILINDCCVDATNRDILCINGVIHAVHNVISPSNNTMGQLLKRTIEDGTGDFVVTAKILDACGLLDTLSRDRDEAYEDLFQKGEKIPKTSSSVGDSGAETFYTPEHRYYGFTLFAETDAF